MSPIHRTRIPRPLAFVTLGSLTGLCIAAGFPASNSSGDGDEVVARAASRTSAAPSALPIVALARGAEFVAPAPTLASQLALDPARALVVLSVDPGAPAGRAGLSEHDVLLAVDGEPATPEALMEATESGGHVELELLRAGQPHIALLPPASAPVSTGFVTQESLAPEHPILRLRSLKRLGEALEQEARDVDARRREVRDAQRATVEEARVAAESLHAECVQEARRFLEDRSQKLWALAQEALAPEVLDAARGLERDLEESLPEERLDALVEGLHDVAHLLEDRFEERLIERHQDEAPRVRRYGCALSRVASGLSSRAHERVHEPWRRLASDREGYARAMGERHRERLGWAAEQFAAIEGALQAQLAHAVVHSVERFADELEERLEELDVPRATEVVASLEDVADQLDARVLELARAAESAVSAYVDEVRPDRERVPALVAARLEVGEGGHVAYAAAIAAAFDRDLEPGVFEESEATRRFLDSLRSDLEREIDATRDVLRPAAYDARRKLHDERERSEEAWDDFRDALKRLGSRASKGGWELDGPHLDGRFPERPKGEVVLVD